jgi:hypothetical protein
MNSKYNSTYADGGSVNVCVNVCMYSCNMWGKTEDLDVECGDKYHNE